MRVRKGNAHALTTMALPKPKLKRKKDARFHELLAEKSDGSSCKCSGVLFGGSVLVQDAAAITALLSAGFYGKGVFSRSVPTHVHTTYTRTRKTTSKGGSDGSSFEPPIKRRKSHIRDILHSDCEEEEQRKKRRLLLHAQWREEEQKMSPTLEHATPQWSSDVSTHGPSVTGVRGRRDEGSSRLTGHSTASGEDDERLTELGHEAVEKTEEEIGTTDKPKPSSSSSEPLEEDLYPVEEPLCLTAEESFYLVTELDLLTVHTPSDHLKCLTPEELWKELCAYCKRFPFTYSAYRHYRQKGWVPKSGFKFGVDFILYKDGPAFYHSSYAILVCEQFGNTTETEQASLEQATGQASGEQVAGGPDSTQSLTECPDVEVSSFDGEVRTVSGEDIVTQSLPEAVENIAEPSCLRPETHTQSPTTSAYSASAGGGSPRKKTQTSCVEEETTKLSELETCSEPRLRWLDVIAHCRVCESSGKELVVCHVTAPCGRDDTHLLPSPECVALMSLQETLVTRWIPDKHR